jgi:sigma-B regulation protein RsbU (phosphoserine phosphatase)
MNPLPVSSSLTPDHLAALYTIIRTMNSSLEFDQALANVIDAVMQITRAERGVLMGYDAASGALTVMAARGLHGETLTQDEAYSTTIVRHVIDSREPLLTNNAMFDDRINPGQSIIMRGLRAILCAPMLVQDRLVGVVYVDTAMKTGNFSNADRDLLSAVASQAGIALENARLYSVAVEKGRLERELQMAREIQEGLLPRLMPLVPGYEVAAVWQSAREMAGDFYDVFQLGDGSLCTVVADVSDKGAPSAMLMAVARSMIRSFAFGGFGSLETISRTNDLILDDTGNGMFVTVYHSRFAAGGHSTHINAGHNPPLLVRPANGDAVFLPRGGRAVGWFPNNPLREVGISLQPGDCIVYYTDGLTDAENPAGEAFGEQRLAKVALHAGDASAQGMLAHLLDAVAAFGEGNPPFDDLTLVVVRYTG